MDEAGGSHLPDGIYAPDATEWIRYDTPNDKVKIKESEMLAVLDRIVRANGLSYTECCFERLDGKIVKAREKPKE